MGRKRKAETEIEEEQHKAEENNIMSKGRKRNWGLLLPKNGILGPDGNPFYHHSVANLRKQHYQRIEECGIRLVHGKFTSTEDRRIRKNWRRFAREQNLKDEDVWKFLPAKHRRAALGDCRRLCSMERMIFEQDFWCKMCRKMDGRIGRQIQTRMCLIFNPFYLSGEASRPWTNADDEKLVDLMQIYGKDCPLLAFKLHRTVTVVEKKVEALLNNKAPALIPHGDRLLDCVCRVAGLSNIFSGIAENFDFSTLNWDEVAKLMDSNEDASILRETFFKKRLPKSVDLFKRSDGGCRKAMKSLTRRDKFSVRAEAIAVIPLLIEHSAKALKDINFEKLKEQLVESGYLRNRVEAAEKCPVITHRIGRQINKLSEKRLHMQLTFNGLRLIHGKFSATEDRRIRKNWRRFAREHNLTDEDVWKFLPARYRRSVLRESLRGSSMEKMIFEEDFWCKMCRKLDGRVGRQVLTRMCTIFNPFYLSGESSRPWTSADDDELMDLMRMHGRDYPLIAFELRRTITSVKNRLNYLLDNRVRPLIPHGDVLLDCVCRVAGLSNIFSGIVENFDFSTLNWEKVAKLADSNEDASKLRKRFFKKKLPYSVGLFELFDGNCRSAIRCMTQDEQFSARDEAIAVIPLLMEHNPKALKDIDLEKFKQQLVDIGYFRNSTEATKKCSLIIHRLGYRINKLTEKRLHVQLTFKEKLRVLLEAYKDPTYSLRKHSILVLKKATSLVQNIVGRKV